MTDLDQAVLAMERQFWRTSGAKDEAIRDQLGMAPTRYYQRLNQIIATEAALEHDAVTVNRLRRVSARRSG